tara:strand:+ start:734 stop:985 length:252 start_codon:yes stop_codon:yes gene_type:complete
MLTFAKIIHVLGVIYVWLAGLFILINLVIIFLDEGFVKIQEILSPFNVANYIVTVITLAPGLGLIMWSNKIKEKAFVEELKDE